MKKLLILSLFATLLISTGCAAMPQTPDEFKTAVGGSMFGKTESYEINKSIGFIKGKFKKYANKCLDKRVSVTTTSGGGFNGMGGYTAPMTRTTITDYKPTLKTTKNSLELFIQQKFVQGGGISVHKMPEGGMYIGVIDAKRVSKKKTELNIYRGKWGKKTMWKAIKGWADGTIKGCPDLSK